MTEEEQIEVPTDLEHIATMLSSLECRCRDIEESLLNCRLLLEKHIENAKPKK